MHTFDTISICFFYLFFIFLLRDSSAAKTRPIVAEPEILGSQSLDSVTGFLLLMSEGLIDALECAHGPEHVNKVDGNTARTHLSK